VLTVEANSWVSLTFFQTSEEIARRSSGRIHVRQHSRAPQGSDHPHLDDTLGSQGDYTAPHGGTRGAYQFVVEALCREYGGFNLLGKQMYERNYLLELANFLLAERDHKKALDAIELSFRVINGVTRTWDYSHRRNASERADDAIAELNARFQETRCWVRV